MRKIDSRIDTGYGYQWWISPERDDRPLAIYGSGYGGQFPVVVPEHDLVVVFNSWSIHQAPRQSLLASVFERILPALDNRPRD